MKDGEKTIATIRYRGGYYVTNIIDRYSEHGNAISVLEYGCDAGINKINYWAYLGKEFKLIKTIQ